MLGGVAEVFLDVVGEAFEDVALHVADMGDVCVLAVGLERGEMGVGAAVEADDGEVEPVVCTDDLGIALCG